MKIIIGLTRTNRTRGDDDYIPSFDGWRAGSAQDQITIYLPDDLANLTRAQLADAVFVATNAPSYEAMAEFAGAKQVHDILSAMRALSIGDTVTVDGRQLACVAVGWVDVTDGADAPPYGQEL